MTTTYEHSKQYVLVDPLSIEITEPPDFTQVPTIYRFFNPRLKKFNSGFCKKDMDALYDSIVERGLKMPLICRLITIMEPTDDPNVILRPRSFIQLVAGERRLRTILKLIKDNVMVFSIEHKKKMPAKEVYTRVNVQLEDDCNEVEALALAWDENINAASLTAADEIITVEYLVACGKSPKEIEVILQKNAAWVNHSINFRTKLPEEAFSCLLNGEITRFVADRLLEYPEDKRTEVWNHTKALHSIKIEEKKEKLKAKVAEVRDTLLLAEINIRTQKKANRDAEESQIAAEKAKKELVEVQEELKEIETNPPVMTGSIVAAGAEKAKTKPITPKALTKKKIEQYYHEPLWAAIDSFEEDPKIDEVAKIAYPKELLELGLAFAEAIANQETNPFKVIRDYLVEIDKWHLPEGEGE